MNTQTSPSVIFLRVTDAKTKVQRIAKAVEHHFLSGDSVIIFVPNEKAAVFLDQLLWSTPAEGFLPHSIKSEYCEEKIVITQGKSNWNQAKAAINLTAEICPDLKSFDAVYELWDQTDEGRVEQSKRKKDAYEKIGL